MKSISIFFILLTLVCLVTLVLCFSLPYVMEMVTYITNEPSTITASTLYKIKTCGYMSLCIGTGSFVEYLITLINDGTTARGYTVMRF